MKLGIKFWLCTIVLLLKKTEAAVHKEFKSSFVCFFVLVEGWQSLLAVCLFCVDIFTLYGQTGSKLSNIRAEQSVCTNLDENAVTRSVLLGSKNIREGRSLNIELKF